MLTEINREVYGNDKRAINRHSARTYEIEGGGLVTLDRTLDMIPPAFEIIGPYDEGWRGFLPTTSVDGKRYFGDGKSWKWAIAKMIEVLKEDESCEPGTNA